MLAFDLFFPFFFSRMYLYRQPLLRVFFFSFFYPLHSSMPHLFLFFSYYLLCPFLACTCTTSFPFFLSLLFYCKFSMSKVLSLVAMGKKNNQYRYDQKLYKVFFFRLHHRPFCPTDALVVGLAPFVFDERLAIRVVQVLDSGSKKKKEKRKAVTTGGMSNKFQKTFFSRFY